MGNQNEKKNSKYNEITLKYAYKENYSYILGEEFVKNNENKGKIIFMSTKKEITKTICRKLAFSSEDVNDNFITIKLLLEKM